MLELSTTNQRSTVTIRFFAYQRYYMYMIGGQLHMNIGSLQILISAQPNRYNHHHAIAIIVCTMIISANPICYAYPVLCDKIGNRKSTSTSSSPLFIVNESFMDRLKSLTACYSMYQDNFSPSYLLCLSCCLQQIRKQSIPSYSFSQLSIVNEASWTV